MANISTKKTTSILAIAFPALLVAGCGGYDAGVDYPGDLPDLDPHVFTAENDTSPSISLGKFKVGPTACKNIDTHTVTQGLTQDDLAKFLESQGVKVPPLKMARTNLYWLDVPNGEGGKKNFVRLRLAVLEDPAHASADLHQTLLQHGPGWWGLRRGNLAVLAPKTSVKEAMQFAVKYKLICWGIFTYAGNDDAYVVPGPYGEL